MVDRFARSWQLIRASAGVLTSDKELLVYPLLSMAAGLVVLASFIAPAVALDWLDPSAGTPQAPITWLWLFGLYVTSYFVAFFFNTALVGAALIRMDGGDPHIGDGLRIASTRSVSILGYALIAATVGLVLRAIEERVGWLGRVVVGLLGVGWTVASFLVVPILVSRNVGPVQAIKESAALLRRTWGENLIGMTGLGLVFGLVYVALIVLVLAAGMVASQLQQPIVFLGVLVTVVLAAILLSALHVTLQGIYSAALYRYAADDQAKIPGFDRQLLGSAFAARKH